MFLAHSLILKLMVFTLPGTAQLFVSIGLLGPLGYVEFVLAAVGGVLLAGVQVRVVSLALLPVLGATWAHAVNGWMFGYMNGGWEYPLYHSVLARVQAVLGKGAFDLSRSWPFFSWRLRAV
jgi:putative oxidoreductase